MIDIELQLGALRVVISWRSSAPAPPRSQPAPSQPELPYTIATSLCVHESSVLQRLRRRLAEAFVDGSLISQHSDG